VDERILLDLAKAYQDNTDGSSEFHREMKVKDQSESVGVLLLPELASR